MSAHATGNVGLISKKASDRHVPRLFKFSVLASFTCLAMYVSFLKYPVTKHTLRANLFHMNAGYLTAITLNFNKTIDHKMIEHNCVTISQTQHRFVIYTDDLSQPYCNVCSCVQFEPIDCKCPHKSRSDCKLCEKLHFVKDRVEELEEFVFLDSDLIILNDRFMDRLFTRSRDFDFLASLGFADPCFRIYHSKFNSGMFFMRKLPGVNYGDLLAMSWKLGTNNDQNAISRFVYEKYRDWDVLSLKWHCRFLKKSNFTIPPGECYTLHGRGPSIEETVHGLNRTFLKVG